MCGLSSTLEITRPLHQEASIGVLLQRSHWNEGYATAACRALLGFVFGELELHRVSATMTVGNERSVRLFSNLGFTRRADCGSTWSSAAHTVTPCCLRSCLESSRAAKSTPEATYRARARSEVENEAPLPELRALRPSNDWLQRRGLSASVCKQWLCRACVNLRQDPIQARDLCRSTRCQHWL
ncbi:MAG: GNAT family N-acetyltransferase [Deltaproteobacteria bacterium]|nr:GNAT family N-acetyltransferase [Deltaproteobacteria bacterium]